MIHAKQIANDVADVDHVVDKGEDRVGIASQTDPELTDVHQSGK